MIYIYIYIYTHENEIKMKRFARSWCILEVISGTKNGSDLADHQSEADTKRRLTGLNVDNLTRQYLDVGMRSVYQVVYSH